MEGKGGETDILEPLEPFADRVDLLLGADGEGGLERSALLLYPLPEERDSCEVEGRGEVLPDRARRGHDLRERRVHPASSLRAEEGKRTRRTLNLLYSF